MAGVGQTGIRVVAEGFEDVASGTVVAVAEAGGEDENFGLHAGVWWGCF